jgi:glycine/D-amino acid oxidase-like deaminating enzyme
MREEHFEIAALRSEADFVSYKDLRAHSIIFCEGAAAGQNPYFKNLPFVPAKGECLILHIPDFYSDKIINGEVFIMPWNKPDEYYCGSTHDWYFDDALPSEKGRRELLGGLQVILKSRYKILEHHAAIRPTVKDRRPFIGFTKLNSRVGIFNGMGTKGISLTPYFARHFVGHLTTGEPLMNEVDINRFIF